MTDADIKRHVNIINEEMRERAKAKSKGWQEVLREIIYKNYSGQKNFCDRTSLSKTVYQRIMRKQGVSLNSLITICLELKMTSEQSFQLISDSGHVFDDSSIIHCCYKYFLNNQWELHDANAILWEATGESFQSLR